MATATAPRKPARKPTAPVVAADSETDRLRGVFKRHREACLYFATKADYLAALAVAAKQVRPDGGTLTPAEWVDAIEWIVLPCDRCRRTGDYCWGGTINGRPVHKATCYHCGGAGRQTIDDVHRNRVHLFHYIRAAAGF